MNAPIPISYRWAGEHMSPLSGRATLDANKTFVVGQVYLLVEDHDRSIATHNHQFAEIAEVWKNLSDDMIDRWPTPKHLRKFALIQCGFTEHRQFVASSKAEALRIAKFIRPKDEYAIINVRGCVVNEWTAMSQSRKAMGAREFQRSKQAVLEFVAGLIKVSPDTLVKEAGRAA